MKVVLESKFLLDGEFYMMIKCHVTVLARFIRKIRLVRTTTSNRSDEDGSISMKTSLPVPALILTPMNSADHHETTPDFIRYFRTPQTLRRPHLQ